VKAAAMNKDILKRVRPNDVAAYLRAHNWVLDEHYEDRESFWSSGTGPGETELLLPLRMDFRDYALRVSDALEVLEVAEGRPRNDILKEIVTAIFDVVRVRVDNPNSRDGSLTLDDGVQLFDNARKMVTSAARSTYEKRAQFIATMPDQVSDYVRKVRVGQTERGSYIVNILSPVISDYDEERLFSTEPYEQEDSFDRRVMHTLAEGLEATYSAAKENVYDPRYAKFEEAVPVGVSANLCEAIAKIGQSGGNTGVEIDLRWALARPPQESRNHKTYFSAVAIPIIEEAGRQLRSTPSREQLLRGYVIKLAREKGLGEAGSITISTVIEDKLRKVGVDLSAAQYQRAVRAHEEDQPIALFGKVERRGKSFLLRDPRDLEVVREDEEDTGAL
jgi:hypothetical protein